MIYLIEINKNNDEKSLKGYYPDSSIAYDHFDRLLEYWVDYLEADGYNELDCQHVLVVGRIGYVALRLLAFDDLTKPFEFSGTNDLDEIRELKGF